MPDRPRLFLVHDNTRNLTMLHPPKKAIEAVDSLSVHVLYNQCNNLYGFNSNVELVETQQLKRKLLKIQGVGSYLPVVSYRTVQLRIDATPAAPVIGAIVKLIAASLRCPDERVTLSPGIVLGQTKVPLIEFINEANFCGSSLHYPPDRTE